MKRRAARRTAARSIRVDAPHRRPAPAKSTATSRAPLQSLYQVLVACADEPSQRALFERLTSEGHACRALVL